MNIRNLYTGYFFSDDEDALEKTILLRSIAASLGIIIFYAAYNFINDDLIGLMSSGLAVVVYAFCHAYITYSNGSDTSKKIVMSLIMLSLTAGFFYRGGLFGITSLNLCGLVLLISAVFSNAERRLFVISYLSLILFFVWVHLFEKGWIVNYREKHSPVFLIAEILIYLMYLLYLGYLYKSEYEKKRRKVIETNKELEDANAEISAQNDYIMSYNDQLKSLVTELEAERNKVLVANRKLKRANLEKARQNKYITSLNSQLEIKVAERTKDIKDLNKKIIQFAQYNAHRIRGPLARIMGLIHIMNLDFNLNSELNYEQSEFYIDNLRLNARELDEMVRGVSMLLADGDMLIRNSPEN